MSLWNSDLLNSHVRRYLAYTPYITGVKRPEPQPVSYAKQPRETPLCSRVLCAELFLTAQIMCASEMGLDKC